MHFVDKNIFYQQKHAFAWNWALPLGFRKSKNMFCVLILFKNVDFCVQVVRKMWLWNHRAGTTFVRFLCWICAKSIIAIGTATFYFTFCDHLRPNKIRKNQKRSHFSVAVTFCVFCDFPRDDFEGSFLWFINRETFFCTFWLFTKMQQKNQKVSPMVPAAKSEKVKMMVFTVFNEFLSVC